MQYEISGGNLPVLECRLKEYETIVNILLSDLAL